MKLFHKLNIPFDKTYLLPYWQKKTNQLNEAIEILFQTIVLGDTFNLFANKKKYFTHIKKYCANFDGLKKSKIAIEWGGGLGVMAHIITNKFKNIEKYIIIDTPVMVYLQILYFKINKIKFNILTNDFLSIKDGINLVALPFIDHIELYPDMFISTWGVSESGKKSLLFCSLRRYFDCKYLLIAHSKYDQKDFPYSSLCGIVDCQRVSIDDNNGYIFR